MNSPTAASSPATATASSAALRWLSLTVLTLFPLPNRRSRGAIARHAFTVVGTIASVVGCCLPQMSDFFLFVADLNATISRGCVFSANSHLYSGTQAPNEGTPARLPTLRVATTAEVKRVLLYLLARLRVGHDIAYRYPAIVADVGGLVRLILLLDRWVRVGCARLSSVHSSVPTFLWAGSRGVPSTCGAISLSDTNII